MCNKEDLVAYIYSELRPEETARFESHLRECAGCRTEVRDLGAAREHLASWSPPQPDLDFTVVRTSRSAVAPRRRVFGFVPEWALSAAAAVLLLAGASALANLEVRYDANGLVVRTGWSAPAQSAATESPAPATRAPMAQTAAALDSPPEIRAQILALAERLRAHEDVEAHQAKVSGATGGQGGITAAQLRKILDEMETRQRTETALQIGQVWRDFNAARANDVAYFQKTLGQAQGLTNYQLRQHRDSIESLYRVSMSK